MISVRSLSRHWVMLLVTCQSVVTTVFFPEWPPFHVVYASRSSARAMLPSVWTPSSSASIGSPLPKLQVSRLVASAAIFMRDGHAAGCRRGVPPSCPRSSHRWPIILEVDDIIYHVRVKRIMILGLGQGKPSSFVALGRHMSPVPRTVAFAQFSTASYYWLCCRSSVGSIY